MLERVRTALKGSPAYSAWAALRGEQQRRGYLRLLDGLVRHAEPVVNVATTLAGRSGARRPFFGSDGRPHVVAFGGEQWEQYGLWPAFTERAGFELFRYVSAPADKHGDALRAACETQYLAAIDAAERLAPVSCAFFYASGYHISDSLLAELHRRGIWTVVMGLDDKQQFVWPADERTGEAHQLRIARQVDVYWTTWKAGVSLIAAAGGRPWYQPEGAHPRFHARTEVPRDLDVVFIGSAYGHRAGLVDYLRARGFAIETRGQGWPEGRVSFEETVALFNRAKVVLGVGGVGHMRSVAHLKGRDFEVPMCGALYLTSFNSELADFYVIGREILCYSSLEDCAEILAWVLRDAGAADSIRRAGHARAIADHDWRKRVDDLFALFPGRAA